MGGEFEYPNSTPFGYITARCFYKLIINRDTIAHDNVCYKIPLFNIEFISCTRNLADGIRRELDAPPGSWCWTLCRRLAPLTFDYCMEFVPFL